MKRFLVFIAFVTFIAVTACVQNEPSDIRFFPDKEVFINGGVSAMMESRCGGLDCHGQVGRPLRIYSKNGLRLATPQEDNALRDNRDTTPEERLENYQSVIGLEPEGLSDTVMTGGQYVDHQLIKKPLDDSSGLGVRHKGGQIFNPPDDPAWRCMLGWLQGEPDQQACTDGTF